MVSTQRTASSQIGVNAKEELAAGQLRDSLCAELNGFNIPKTRFTGVKRHTKQLDLGKDTACLEPLGLADAICSRSGRLPRPKVPGSSVLTR